MRPRRTCPPLDVTAQVENHRERKRAETTWCDNMRDAPRGTAQLRDAGRCDDLGTVDASMFAAWPRSHGGNAARVQFLTLEAAVSRLEVARILCPTDFSEESVAAVRCAASIAEAHAAELLLIHAVEPLPYPVEFGPLPAMLADAEPTLLKRSREQLESLRQKEIGSAVKCRTLAELGIPEHAICDTAKREKCDLIVLSTHGRSGLSHLLLGSVAERVLRFAPCPVLSIKPPARSS